MNVKRYDLQEQVKEIKGKNLSAFTISIVGLGTIGSCAAELCARAGINLRVIDKDRVHEHELPQLSIFGEEHIGKFKAKEAKKLLEGLGKGVKVKAFHEEIMENNAYLVEADLIIECSDSLETGLLVDKAAKKKPLIYARAGGVEAHVLAIDKTRLRHMKKFLERNYPKREGILGSTAKITAALAVHKAIKILLKHRHEQNYLVVNAWNFSMEKRPVRKDGK